MPPAKSSPKWKYDLHPAIAMHQSMVAGLQQKSGRTLEEWITLVDKDGPANTKERKQWLKARHGLGLNYASLIAERSEGEDWSPESYLKRAPEYVDKMFSGPKSALRPITMPS